MGCRLRMTTGVAFPITWRQKCIRVGDNNVEFKGMSYAREPVVEKDRWLETLEPLPAHD